MEFCTRVAVRPTNWDPCKAKLALNVTVEGCIVPSMAGGSRTDAAHMVVLDEFVDDGARQEILDGITAPGHPVEAPPPGSKWARKTSDGEGLPVTWGLREEALRDVATSRLGAMLEVHARLCKLYPDVDIFHMPSTIQGRGAEAGGAAAAAGAAGGGAGGAGLFDTEVLQDPLAWRAEAGGAAEAPGGGGGGSDRGTDCDCFVANAACHGDDFRWHVDADPCSFPPSPWTEEFGDYVNREPGKPLFVSVIMYLNDSWAREWDAETLFLDTPSGAGVFVRPKPGRVVIMDQDIVHRVSQPSRKAGRPRYSLVWKLVFVPKKGPRATACIARPQWGRPTAFGSAAKLEALVSQVAAGKRARPGEGGAGGGGAGTARGGGRGRGVVRMSRRNLVGPRYWSQGACHPRARPTAPPPGDVPADRPRAAREGVQCTLRSRHPATAPTLREHCSGAPPCNLVRGGTRGLEGGPYG